MAILGQTVLWNGEDRSNFFSDSSLNSTNLPILGKSSTTKYLLFAKHCTHFQRRLWQPTPVFLPGESRDREARQATVHWVAESQAQLKGLIMHAEKAMAPLSSTLA